MVYHVTDVGVCKLAIAPYSTVGYHHTLGIARRTTRVVDDGKFFRTVLIVVDVMLAEVHGELLAEQTVQVLAGISQLLAATGKEMIVDDAQNTLEVWHLVC